MSYKKIVTIMTLVVLLLLTMSTTIQAVSVGKVYGLEASMNGDNILLEWNSVSNASGYNVYADGRKLGFVNTTAVELMNFSENTTYRFKVIACDYQGREGTASDEVRFNTKVEPTLGKVNDLKISQVEGNVTLNWSSVSRANKYQIFVDIPNFGEMNVGEVNSTAVILQGLKDGLRYGFSVRAGQTLSNGKMNLGEKATYQYCTIDYDIDDNYNDDYYDDDYNKNIGTVTVSVYDVTETEATVSWTKNNNADGYEVLLSKNGGSYKCIKDVTSRTKTSVDIYDLDSDTSYKVKVVPYEKINSRKVYGDESSYKSFKTDKKVDYTPAQVKNLYIDNIEKYSAEANWSSVSNADGYNIYLSINGGSFKYEGTTSRTYYNITNLDDNTNYKVKVEAYRYVNGKEYTGSSSDQKSFTTLKAVTVDTNVGKVKNLTVEGVGKDSAYITWSRVADASSYYIYLAEGNGSYREIGQSLNNDFHLTNLKPNTKYKVQVAAYKLIAGEVYVGERSSSKTFTTNKSTGSDSSNNNNTSNKVGIATHLFAEVKNINEAYLSWWPVDNADGYDIYLTENGQNFELIKTVDENNAIIMSRELDYSTTYKVKVKAFAYDRYGNKTYSNSFSETREFKTEKYDRTQNSSNVGIVTGLNEYVIGQSVYFNWNKIYAAEGYEIDFVVPGVPGSTKLPSNTNYKEVKGVTDTKYNYTARVRAYRTINGIRYYGEWSDVVKFKAK